MSDAIYVNGIRAFGHLGVLPEERTLGQWFEVDLKLSVDLAQAGQSDRLDDTYDYSQSIKAIQTLIQTTQVQLIESVAEVIAALLLQDPRITAVQVRLTKQTPPIPEFGGTVAVEITRSAHPS
jgi:7,8-dihydroneopterin aldolase/epimerase/oxygenase